ncbi:MAG: isocitrate lyase/PEP mutase family protein [Dehalococcoidia bacterium]
MSQGAKLRALLRDGMVVAPFVFDGLTAKIAQAAGFSAVYRTGHGTAARLGMTDAGLVTFSEMLENLNYVCDAVDVPVIADADTGYGNAVNVTRTVRAYEKAGAAALHIEDQVFPKKCGFFEGKQVVAVEEHVQKVRAALEARRDEDFVIIARTDALAVHGWEETVRRCKAYAAAGADLVFVDGIKTVQDLDIYQREVIAAGLPCMYNGSLVSTQDAAARGFSLMITGGGHGIAYLAMREALHELRRTGRHPAPAPEPEYFMGIADLLGVHEVNGIERRFAVEAPASAR